MTQEQEIWIEMKDIKENTFISNFGRVKKIFLNGKNKNNSWFKTFKNK